jgi:hypothetical protein
MYIKEQEMVLFENQALQIGMLNSNAVISRGIRITWDQSKHTLVSAKLYCRADVSGDMNSFVVWLNNQETGIHFHWGMGDFSRKTAEVEISSLIQNGKNSVFDCEFRKDYGWAPSTPTVWFDLVLTLTWEIVEGASPPSGDFLIPYIGLTSFELGVLAIGIGGICIGAYAYTRRKKK